MALSKATQRKAIAEFIALPINGRMVYGGVYITKTGETSAVTDLNVKLDFASRMETK